MYRFIQKYNKKLLAIFAVFLMIVFILPTTFSGMGSPGDRVMGYFGEDEAELTANQFQQAFYEWEMLSRPLPQLQISLAMALLSPDVAMQINEHPEMYLLLQEEARRMGVKVNQDRLQSLLTNELATLLPPDPTQRDAIRRGIESLMLIQAAFGRAASTVKVSAPMRDQMIGEEMQSIGVRLVEFEAKEFAEQVPAPTPQEMQAHFQQFASTPRDDAAAAAAARTPTTGPTTNPFGFGYQYPNRVKLQYIAVPRADVRKAVEASKTPYEWEVEGRKYYQKNPHLFPTTRPTTTPSGIPFTLATQPATTGPTTKPFEQVRDDIKARLVEPMVDQKITQVAARIGAILAADHASYVVATGGATRPTTTAPASSLGVPFNSFAYMSKLAEAIQSEFGVLPTVVSLEDQWRTKENLEAIPGVSAATGPGELDFPTYATELAEPLVPPEQRDGQNVLSLYEPSRTLRDFMGNVYVFRVTDAQPAHAPESVEQVADAVRRDLIAARTYERAKQAAQTLLEEARQRGLEPAAASANKPIIKTGLFRHSVPGEIPNYPLAPAEAQQRFRDQAFELLAEQPQGTLEKPARLIELPDAGKVLVAQLDEVKAEWQSQTRYLLEQGALAALSQRQVQQFADEWFDYDNVVARLNYRPTDTPAPTGPAPATPQPRPPMF